MKTPFNKLICIDPGVRGVGLAVFNFEGFLSFACYVKNERFDPASGLYANARHLALAVRDAALAVPEDMLIIEQMVVYPGPAKVDNNDLIHVSACAGAIVSALSCQTVLSVKGRDWKGNVPKAVMTDRISSKLILAETAKIAPVASSLRHNVIDAIGIGLWHFGRLNTQKFIKTKYDENSF